MVPEEGRGLVRLTSLTAVWPRGTVWVEGAPKMRFQYGVLTLGPGEPKFTLANQEVTSKERTLKGTGTSGTDERYPDRVQRDC